MPRTRFDATKHWIVQDDDENFLARLTRHHVVLRGHVFAAGGVRRLQAERMSRCSPTCRTTTPARTAAKNIFAGIQKKKFCNRDRRRDLLSCLYASFALLAKWDTSNCAPISGYIPVVGVFMSRRRRGPRVSSQIVIREGLQSTPTRGGSPAITDCRGPLPELA